MNISEFIPIQFKSQTKTLEESSRVLNDKSVARDIQLKEKSKDIEAVFLTQLFKSMEKTIPKNLTGSNQNMATMMFSSVMGEAMSKGEGLGLSDMIYQSLREKDTPANTDNLQALDGLDEIYTNTFLEQGVDK